MALRLSSFVTQNRAPTLPHLLVVFGPAGVGKTTALCRIYAQFGDRMKIFAPDPPAPGRSHAATRFPASSEIDFRKIWLDHDCIAIDEALAWERESLAAFVQRTQRREQGPEKTLILVLRSLGDLVDLGLSAGSDGVAAMMMSTRSDGPYTFVGKGWTFPFPREYTAISIH